MGLKAQCARQQSRAANVCSGSISTDAISARSAQCPLCSESDPMLHGSETTRWAKRRPEQAQQNTRVLGDYSITSSARKWIDDGTSRPSALAVLRLTASSNVTGCKTGSWDGLAPLINLPA